LLQRLRSLSHLLDNALPLPGTSFRIGIDPLLGLVPGGGDIASAMLSAYIVLEAMRFRLPRETLSRMLLNLLSDAALGMFPVLGDLFDVTWKANSRNLALLEAHLQNPRPQQAADRVFVAFVVLVMFLIILSVATIAVLVTTTLWNLLAGVVG
jgi:hypothetical protein